MSKFDEAFATPFEVPSATNFITEPTRDALIHDLGTAAFEDDIVWNHLRTSVGRCSEREMLVAVVRCLVAARRELHAQCVELAMRCPRPVALKIEGSE